MKTVMVKGGFDTWINSRENKFIKQMFADSDRIKISDLSEREAYIAENLLNRGVLRKYLKDNIKYYKLNTNNFFSGD
jgi:hypothetical protein